MLFSSFVNVKKNNRSEFVLLTFMIVVNIFAQKDNCIVLLNKTIQGVKLDQFLQVCT